MAAFRTILVMSAAAAIGALIAIAPAQIAAQTASAAAAGQTTAAKMPADVNPQTSNRFPPVKRDDLDAAGKKIYDDHVAEKINLSGGGPVALRMWDPPVAEHGHAMNQYLRTKAGLPPNIVELVIITTTRELNAPYEYSGHEPAALKAGVPPQVVDAVKFRKPLTGLPEREAAVIELTREAVGQRKVSSATFARAEKLFDRKALVSMAALMGEYNAAAILLAVAGQEMPPGRPSLLPALGTR
jgi:4-carboxymuconolactone decarboxylase